MLRGIRLVPSDTKINFLRFHKVTFAISVFMVVASFGDEWFEAVIVAPALKRAAGCGVG